ncbi:MAG: type II secretion system protein [Planctomycetota bacterium]|jgi:prepilin-type N-terminal cleavage/methylation domain-containing protein/prepilin-type processing-associated H-X9-DG protein
MAVNKVKSNNSVCRQFTLVELLVVIAIISILAGMLLPALENAMDSAKSISCMNSCRQVLSGFNQYAQDYEGVAPPYRTYFNGGASNYYWPFHLWSYLESLDVYKCPSEDETTLPGAFYTDHTPNTIFSGYGYNVKWLQMGQSFNSYDYDMEGAVPFHAVKNPSRAICIVDGLNLIIASGAIDALNPYSSNPPDFRHNEGANTGYVDGHADLRGHLLEGGPDPIPTAPLDWHTIPDGGESSVTWCGR